MPGVDLPYPTTTTQNTGYAPPVTYPIVTAKPVKVPVNATQNKGTAANPWAGSNTSTFVTPTASSATQLETQVQNALVIEPDAQQLTQGNALITIPILNSSGKLSYQQFNVWIYSIQTGSYTSYDNDQVHRGMIWFPIRRNEQFLQFNIMWPHQSKKTKNGFQNMQSFQNYIRLHQQQSVLTNGYPNPLTVVYYNNTGTGHGIGKRNKSEIVDNNLVLKGNNQILLSQSTEISSTSSPTVSSSLSVNRNGSLQALSYQGWIDRVEKEYRRYKSAYTKSYRMNILNTDVASSRLVVDASESSIVPTVISTQQYGAGWSNANLSLGNGINMSGITG